MADAKITVTFTPAEFDLLRESLRDQADAARLESQNNSATPKTRQEKREYSARVTAILSKLK